MNENEMKKNNLLKDTNSQPTNLEIKKLNFKKTNVTIKEYYIDENGHEQEREKTIVVPAFPLSETSTNEDA